MKTASPSHFDRRYQSHLKHLKLKGLQPKTIDAYSRAIRRIGDYFDHHIDHLTEAQLTDYFSDLITSHSWSTVKLDLYGLKFYYDHVLRQPWIAPGLIKPPKGQRLPDIVTDAGYHSEANLKALAEQNIEALIADNGMRQRDDRFKDQARHKGRADPLYDKSKTTTKAAKPGQRYRPGDFVWTIEAGTCICPAGKSLYQNGANCQINGRLFTKFTGTQRDCGPCLQRDQCLRHPDKTLVRQVSFSRGKVDPVAESFTEKMKRAIDSEEGKRRYGQRFATVEPVFGNLRHNKQLNRFTLRGQKNVDTQWKLYCLVHNIENGV